MSNDEELKTWTPARGISPLASAEERDSYRLQREVELRSILKGPSDIESWYRANEELLEMRFGGRGSEKDEWEYGR